MLKTRICGLLLACAIPFSLIARDEENNTEQPGVIQPNPDGPKYVKVSVLDGIPKNEEFQRNVEIMQIARQRVAELLKAVEAETDEEQKAKLQEQADRAMKELDQNNELMIKMYGFSLNRRYLMITEKTHIYMEATPEEVEVYERESEKYKQEQAKKAAESK